MPTTNLKNSLEKQPTMWDVETGPDGSDNSEPSRIERGRSMSGLTLALSTPRRLGSRGRGFARYSASLIQTHWQLAVALVAIGLVAYATLGPVIGLAPALWVGGRIPTLTYASLNHIGDGMLLSVVAVLCFAQAFLMLVAPTRVPFIARKREKALEHRFVRSTRRLQNRGLRQMVLALLLAMPAGGGIWWATGLAHAWDLNPMRTAQLFGVLNSVFFTLYYLLVPLWIAWLIIAFVVIAAALSFLIRVAYRRATRIKPITLESV